MLMNYIALVPGIPTRMHFTDDYEVERSVMEKEIGKLKRIKSLIFWVDELEGADVAKTFSVMSQKLRATLTPYLKDKEYTRYDFIITKMGDEFYTDWNIQVIRRPEME